MMIRTQRIRRISATTQRPTARRPIADPLRRARRGESVTAPVRRVGPLARPLPVPAKKRRRPHRLRLVVVNLRPRRRRDVRPKPSLRLVRGGALSVVPQPRPRPRPLRAPSPRPSRVGQLVFVVAMAAVGLAALATSVGQILARAM
jgi:hypothetical protein